MIFDLTDNIQLTLPSYFEQGLIILTFCVLIITVFLAYKRLHTSIRFAIVTVLNVVSFLALIALISDVKVKQEAEFAQVLLTYGTSQAQIDSLSTDTDTGTKTNERIFALSSLSSINAATPAQHSLDLASIQSKLIVIDNAAEILAYQSDFQQLSVYGDGLSSEQWQSLQRLNHTNSLEKNNTIKVLFFPSEFRTGPINVQWPKQLILGQPFYIQGLFKAATQDNDRIYNITLSDQYDETVDEFSIKHNEKFNLSTSIKNQGLFIYQLKVLDDNQQLLLSEPVAFTVSSAAQIKVAIKQSSPSFESKYLKNWLAEQGEEVLVLTQISKDKHIQQTINGAANKGEMVNKTLAVSWLKHVDLLYMDGRAFLTLSDKEIAQLDKAITQGLGLVVIVYDEIVASANKLKSHVLVKSLLVKNPLLKNIETNDFLSTTSTSVQGLSTIPRWLHSQGELVIGYKNANLSSAHGKPFIKGSEGQALWTKYSHGLGSVAFSLVDTSYQWVTSGETTHYSQYWQHIIEQIARQNTSSTWQNESRDDINIQGQKQVICAQLKPEDFDKVNAKEIHLLASFASESAYCGAYWGNSSGWKTFNLVEASNELNQKTVAASLQSSPLKASPSSNQQSSFVYAQQDWSTWQQDLKQKASVLVAENSSNRALKAIYIQHNKKSIWALFFICLSVLWLERKVF